MQTDARDSAFAIRQKMKVFFFFVITLKPRAE